LNTNQELFLVNGLIAAVHPISDPSILSIRSAKEPLNGPADSNVIDVRAAANRRDPSIEKILVSLVACLEVETMAVSMAIFLRVAPSLNPEINELLNH
jgi:hypothetical protein